MSNKNLTQQDRVAFAAEKSASAVKWMAYSGTITFFLTGLLDVIAQLELPSYIVLGLYLVVNTTIYAVAKYREGAE